MSVSASPALKASTSASPNAVVERDGGEQQHHRRRARHEAARHAERQQAAPRHRVAGRRGGTCECHGRRANASRGVRMGERGRRMSLHACAQESRRRRHVAMRRDAAQVRRGARDRSQRRRPASSNAPRPAPGECSGTDRDWVARRGQRCTSKRRPCRAPAPRRRGSAAEAGARARRSARRTAWRIPARTRRAYA